MGPNKVRAQASTLEGRGGTEDRFRVIVDTIILYGMVFSIKKLNTILQ
jgi:hypothetical protein